MTFTVKYRGGRAPMVSEYECPMHGRFEELVERDENGNPPEALTCPVIVEPASSRCIPGKDAIETTFPRRCLALAEYRISAPMGKVRSVEAVKGGWSKPERPTFTDTRNIGEGQALYDWKEDRAKVWEQKRREDVVKFAREHHESVIGGD